MAESYLQCEDENAAVHCDNCEWQGIAKDLDIIRDIQERIMPGWIVPAGQCPKCGALAYLSQPDKSTPQWKAQNYGFVKDRSTAPKLYRTEAYKSS